MKYVPSAHVKYPTDVGCDSYLPIYKSRIIIAGKGYTRAFHEFVIYGRIIARYFWKIVYMKRQNAIYSVDRDKCVNMFYGLMLTS